MLRLVEAASVLISFTSPGASGGGPRCSPRAAVAFTRSARCVVSPCPARSVRIMLALRKARGRPHSPGMLCSAENIEGHEVRLGAGAVGRGRTGTPRGLLLGIPHSTEQRIAGVEGIVLHPPFQ